MFYCCFLIPGVTFTLLTRINVNPNMDKELPNQLSVGWIPDPFPNFNIYTVEV